MIPFPDYAPEDLRVVCSRCGGLRWTARQSPTACSVCKGAGTVPARKPYDPADLDAPLDVAGMIEHGKKQIEERRASLREEGTVWTEFERVSNRCVNFASKIARLEAENRSLRVIAAEYARLIAERAERKRRSE